MWRRQREDDGRRRQVAISYSVSAHDRNRKFASGMPSSWLPSWCLRSLLGSLSTRVFETRTTTGSELFSLLTCPHTTTFTLLSIFSPLEISKIGYPNTVKAFGSLGTRGFEAWTTTGSELFSLLTCPHTTTFTLLSIFSL